MNLFVSLFYPTSDNREESDNEDWEARENSRTHSVKFSEDSNADKETPFVRQNTPHPKELKAKAHKLFSKDKKDEETNLFPLSEEVILFPAVRLRWMLRNIWITFSIQQSQRTDNTTIETTSEIATHHHATATVAHIETQNDVASPNDVSRKRTADYMEIVFKLNFYIKQDSAEKRVVFHEEDQHQEYSDGENNENDKRPVSKLHRRDTPHHLKNKRVQQHLNDKAANVILSKLKEMPQPVIDEVSPQIEMNPMPLVQDVGLPIIEDYPEMSQNGIDLDTHPVGKFSIALFTIVQLLAHQYLMNISLSLHQLPKSICKNRNEKKSFIENSRLGIVSWSGCKKRRKRIFIIERQMARSFYFT